MRVPKPIKWHSNLPFVKRTTIGSIICCIDGKCYADDAPFHGTPGGYTNHQCKCEACRAAWAKHHKESGAQIRYRARLRAKGLTANGTPLKPGRKLKDIKKYEPKKKGS